MLGNSWPIWFMTWWVMWQCRAQSPGLSAMNSMSRVLPTGTRIVPSNCWAEGGIGPASVPRGGGEPVGDEDADAVALDGLDERPVNRAVVAPAPCAEAGRELVAFHLVAEEVDGWTLPWKLVAGSGP